MPNTDRPSKAEVRWRGAMDDVLVDVCPTVELWGLNLEVKHWHKLQSMEEYKDLTNMEVSELVIVEDWPAKL